MLRDSPHDGDCLPAALAIALFNDVTLAPQVRRALAEHLKMHSVYFSRLNQDAAQAIIDNEWLSPYLLEAATEIFGITLLLELHAHGTVIGETTVPMPALHDADGLVMKFVEKSIDQIMPGAIIFEQKRNHFMTTVPIGHVSS